MADKKKVLDESMEIMDPTIEETSSETSKTILNTLGKS